MSTVHLNESTIYLHFIIIFKIMSSNYFFTMIVLDWPNCLVFFKETVIDCDHFEKLIFRNIANFTHNNSKFGKIILETTRN